MVRTTAACKLISELTIDLEINPSLRSISLIDGCEFSFSKRIQSSLDCDHGMTAVRRLFHELAICAVICDIENAFPSLQIQDPPKQPKILIHHTSEPYELGGAGSC